VTQGYNSRLHRNAATSCCNNDHYALDFALQLGEPVSAIAPGLVAYAGPSAGLWNMLGNIVFIEHQHGIQSLYGHLDTVAVVTGQEVAAGAVIGTAGGRGGVPVHLHLALYQAASFLHTLGGIGPYGGRSVLPEPFTQCRRDSGSPCEHLVTGDRLVRLQG
jgi:murein DD-endopeptidase MepM/ murein hydrolase activator NlpD